MSTESETAEAWLRYARSDLALARAEPWPQEVLPESLCFHAQQAAEKAIKAVLTLCAVEFARSHNIGELLDLLPATAAKESLPDEAALLSDYAASARKPAKRSL